MKYFSYDSYEENHKLFRMLSAFYHPDNPNGNEDMYREITNEWAPYEKAHRKKRLAGDTVKPKHESKDEIEEINFVSFRGKKYYGTEEEILEKIALQYGGLTLIEFTNSKEWREYINR